MRSRPALGIARPSLRKVELPVDEGVPVLGGISREHADLAVGDLAGRAGVLAGDAAGRLALLQEPGFVDHQHGIGRAEHLDHVVAHDIAQRIGIPGGTAEHRLLAPRPCVARGFRPHPAGLAPLRPEQPVDIRRRRFSNARVLKQRPHPSLALPQRRRPQVEHRLKGRSHTLLQPAPSRLGWSRRVQL
jgi:hypothetical protein